MYLKCKGKEFNLKNIFLIEKKHFLALLIEMHPIRHKNLVSNKESCKFAFILKITTTLEV